MNKLVKNIIKRIEGCPNDRLCFEYVLPIDLIDEMPISCELYIQTRSCKKISLFIKSRIIHFVEGKKIYFAQDLLYDYTNQGDDELRIYLDEEIKKIITDLCELLSSLKFNKLKGRFLSTLNYSETIIYENSLEYETEFYENWKKMLDFPNIKLIYNECSVCSCVTETKTKCSHTLCYVCWEHIKVANTGDDFLYQNCPICRCIINEVIA